MKSLVYISVFSILLSSILIAPMNSYATSVVYSTDFNSGIDPEFSGSTSLEAVQGYGAYGFGGNFLRNDDIPATTTTLTLTGLPAHDSVDISFLLGIIDSWDGKECRPDVSPDIFNVRVDGVLIFSEYLENSTCGTQTFSPSAGVELARHVQLGFNPDGTYHLDSAYDMGLEPIFQNIVHSDDTLTIEWYASGAGWQGVDDESWAIDNVEVSINPIQSVAGELLPLNTTSLLIAGIQTNLLWMIPTLAGLVTSVVYLRAKMHND